VCEIVRATNARLFGDAECVVCGITTDSRSPVANKLFVALSGDQFDGHNFLPQVVEAGARAVLVEREPVSELSVPVLKVDSTTRALGDIARFHRDRWRGKVIAIAGSAGKTTTRVACQALLETIHPGKVLATLGNLNNQVGVPMTLLGLTEVHDCAVIEVGTNCLGEIRRLAEVCQPNVAVLTLIGLEHTEGLGDIDSIEAEEGDIFGALAPGAIAIGNGDDHRVLRQMGRGRSNARRVTFGYGNNVDYCVTHQIGRSLDSTEIGVQRSNAMGEGKLTFESRLLGMPGAMAAAAALAVAESLGSAINQRLVESVWMREDLGEAGRLQLVKLDHDIVVLDDCYNANPPSMASSIAEATHLARLRRSRLFLVLGEMLELGAQSEREHRVLGTRLGAASQLIAVGEQAQPLYESACGAGVAAEFFANSSEAAKRVVELAEPHDVVLVKGSRGVRLERVVQALAARKGHAA
jgi:UDP-N-acetylmuramoyl-tripeptide--D-alanyl-D-alanine ligase